MRQAASISRDPTIVSETRDRFYVRERRPAQHQPFGLEDEATRLVQCRGWDILQHVGAPACENQNAKLKGEAGFPPPLWSPFELRRFNRTRRTHFVHRLLGLHIRHRENRHESAAVGLCTKHDMAFDLGEQSMIGAHADIKAGMPGGAALARDDVAGNHMLAAVGLDSEALARRITSVTR